MDSVSVGVDVGGTLTKVVALTGGGSILREFELPTQGGEGPQRFIERLGSVLRLLASELGRSPAALGLALAGEVDSRRGILRYAPNLPKWNGFDFRRALRGRVGGRVVVENDANMAVWGAYVRELKRKPKHVVGITLGTGVGGGLVIDGRLHRGATGSAGEFGHMRVNPRGRRCRCGSRGCLEAYLGAWALLADAKRALRRRPSRALRTLCPDLRRLETRHLALAAQGGDRVCRQIWEEAGENFALGLAGLVMILNPEVVLLLGGVSKAGKLLLSPLRRRLAAEPFRAPFRGLSVRASRNPNWGCVGAALFALEPDPGAR